MLSARCGPLRAMYTISCRSSTPAYAVSPVPAVTRCRSGLHRARQAGRLQVGLPSRKARGDSQYNLPSVCA